MIIYILVKLLNNNNKLYIKRKVNKKKSIDKDKTTTKVYFLQN